MCIRDSIEAGPCVVTQIKTVEKDTYEAVQIAYDEKSEKHTSSSLLGHFKKAGTTPKRKMAEFKMCIRDRRYSRKYKTLQNIHLQGFRFRCFGGEYEIRTRDLLHAMQAL